MNNTVGKSLETLPHAKTYPMVSHTAELGIPRDSSIDIRLKCTHTDETRPVYYHQRQMTHTSQETHKTSSTSTLLTWSAFFRIQRYFLFSLIIWIPSGVHVLLTLYDRNSRASAIAAVSSIGLCGLWLSIVYFWNIRSLNELVSSQAR